MNQQRSRGVSSRHSRVLSVALICASAFSAPVQAFSINLTFDGLSSTQQSYFLAAKSFWESVITGYQSGAVLPAVSIAASAVVIDGLDEILGQAGPLSSVGASSGFSYVATGVMQFDIPDIQPMIDSGIFGDVIKHEMAHVLGFGTLWEANGLFSVAAPGRYIGTHALAAYRAEFNIPGAAFVPVEKAGGPGTADSHWNEADFGWGPTGVVDAQGRDMQYELMTGWLNSPTFVSATTVASFQDLGYTVNLSAVPEVGTATMLFFGLPLLAATAFARRRSTALSTQITSTTVKA